MPKKKSKKTRAKAKRKVKKTKAKSRVKKKVKKAKTKSGTKKKVSIIKNQKELIYKTKKEWISKALVNKAEYEKKYNLSIKNNDEFWRKEGKRITWIKPYKKIKDVKKQLSEITKDVVKAAGDNKLSDDLTLISIGK